MTSVVLDASALIAVLRSEPGAEIVAAKLADAVIGAVNYSEVLKKAIERGSTAQIVASYVQRLSLPVVPFDIALAGKAAELYPAVKALGLSFADRACLALAADHGATVLTTDRKWAELTLPVKVRLVRHAH